MSAPVQRTVLVVDDREENRYTLTHALIRAGFRTIEAATGMEALELSKQMPDVIALDVRLPDILGYEVCRRLRANPKTSPIPVLQLSATFLTTESKLYALESGADAYLAQPVDPLILVATVRSLIRLRDAEQQAQQASLQWAATFDALSEGVALIDDGVVKRCNRAMTELLSMSYKDVEGASYSDLLRTHFGLANESAQDAPATVVQVKNRFFRVGTCSLPENDSTSGSIFIVADVTAQKQAEQALLLNERLAATGRMAHTIAHEINNPLEAVTNLIYLAQGEKMITDESRGFLASAADEVQRIAQISKQILSFHREAAAPAKIPIAELVENVLALSARDTFEQNIETVMEMDHTLMVSGYPARLRQAFSNIIRNAIEASPSPGKLRIRISKSRVNEMPAARVTISDGGAGIAPEHRARIFEAFYTTKEEKGSGIGLWLTQSIIEEHQGRLQFRSSNSPAWRGTSFSIVLPLLR